MDQRVKIQQNFYNPLYGHKINTTLNADSTSCFAGPWDQAKGKDLFTVALITLPVGISQSLRPYYFSMVKILLGSVTLR